MLKVAILVFSPSGSTLTVGKMLESALAERGVSVQLIDITRNWKFVGAADMNRVLKEAVKPHDIVCIGGPVYSKHLHYTVQNLMKALPKTLNGWGRAAIPFVTWGGISSGVALHEAAELIKAGGRTVVAGMKIEASHSLSLRFPKPINPGMPGKEAVPVIEDLADRIASFQTGNSLDIKNVAGTLNYQGIKEKIKAHLLFREKTAHRHGFPHVVYDHDLCTQCGTCVKGCPVQRLELTDSGPAVGPGALECIHCAQCFHQCPSDAVSFDLTKGQLEQFITRGAEGKGLLANPEMPKSGVYPLG